MVIKNDIDSLNAPPEIQKKKKKKIDPRRLLQPQNFPFMDIKCGRCSEISTVYSYCERLMMCGNCGSVLCVPTAGGRVRIPKKIWEKDI